MKGVGLSMPMACFKRSKGHEEQGNKTKRKF